MGQRRFPIGKYTYTGMNDEQRLKWTEDIEKLPSALKSALAGMTEEQYDTPYRDGGWTVRQLVHHIADSTMNFFIRFKLALSEQNPTIKPFNEEPWALMVDSTQASPELSLAIIEGVHERFTMLIRSMSRADFEKQFYHPEKVRQIHLAQYLGYVAWHGKHHYTQIADLKERKGW